MRVFRSVGSILLCWTIGYSLQAIAWVEERLEKIPPSPPGARKDLSEDPKLRLVA